MNALVTASFLLVGWNTYSAIVVAKDTYSGKMPRPKSIGYSIAGLAGLTAFMLYTYGIAAEKHPELLEAESFSAEDREESERMTRPEAEALADKVEKLVAPYVDRVEVCGSYRRGSARPGDLDVIIIPKKGVTLPDMVKAIKPSAVNWIGEKKTQVILDDRKVDFRVSSPKGWGAAQLYFTGPAGYNIGMRMRAKKMGMKLNEYGIFDRSTDKYLGGETEDEIYKVLGKTLKLPADRSKRAEGEPVGKSDRCAQCGSIGETFTVHTRRGLIKHFCGPICHNKYEGFAAETLAFEAPRATYADPTQQLFEKSYNIRAKKHLNKLVKDKMGGKLPSDDNRQSYYGHNGFSMENMTKADVHLIQGYFTIHKMAQSRFQTTNKQWNGTGTSNLNAANVVELSVKETPYLSAAIKHYHAFDGMTEPEMIQYIMKHSLQKNYQWAFHEMLAFIRYYDITTTGPYAGIRMVGTDRAPYNTSGGYGDVYYSSRNPYDTGNYDVVNWAKWDKGTNKFSDSSKKAGMVFTRLTKMRPYTFRLDPTYSADSYIEYCTDGGQSGGWNRRGSGQQCFYLTPFICPENSSSKRNPDPGYSRQNAEGWKYQIEDWEQVKSAPYRYSTLVSIPTQEELQLIHGGTSKVLSRKELVSLYNTVKRLRTAANKAQEAKEKKEEAIAQAKSSLAHRNQALSELEGATKAMKDSLKTLVKKAQKRGVPDDEINDALEHTLFDIEEMIMDWEPDDYFHAEGEYGCKKCGTGPHPVNIVDGQVIVLCPVCGFTEGSEDARAWSVDWKEDSPTARHNRPFGDVEWDDNTPEE